MKNDRRIMAADRAEEAEEIIPTITGRRTYLSKNDLGMTPKAKS